MATVAHLNVCLAEAEARMNTENIMDECFDYEPVAGSGVGAWEGDTTDPAQARAEELEKKEQLEKLMALTEENLWLHREVLRYQQQWCEVLNLLQEVCRSIESLQHEIQHCFTEEAEAERNWLAARGIRNRAGHHDYTDYRPAGWI